MTRQIALKTNLRNYALKAKLWMPSTEIYRGFKSRCTYGYFVFKESPSFDIYTRVTSTAIRTGAETSTFVKKLNCNFIMTD